MPALTESFLAKDFDYGEYLSIMLGQSVEHQLKMNLLTMVNCAPLLICLFLFIAQEPTVYYNEMLDISVSSTAIMNTVLLICIAITLALYGWVKFEIDSI